MYKDSPTNCPWQDPFAVANHIAAEYSDCVFLHSSLQTPYSGTQSILAFDKADELKSNTFQELGNKLSTNQAVFENAWFGYLGYGLKHDVEKLPEDEKGFYEAPDLWFMRFKKHIVWNHEDKTMALYGLAEDDIKAEELKTSALSISSLKSNMTKAEYLNHVATIQDGIQKGDLYQANLTRKFFGTIEGKPSPFAIYHTLNQHSPAPFSAYIKFDGLHVLSSSPESFLNITKEGKVTARPIKGSLAANAPAEGLHNEKDKAENLMIVDLMRNDLSRTAKPESVSVPGLYDISSFSTIHHMYSTIESEKAENVSTLDVVKTCFPPGSMTGTPKIKAMEVCTALEKQERGIYSGAIGWFAGDGSADLSVIIRTLIIKDDFFEFQVGGAIVADSSPTSEWQETMTKAKGIAKTLGISQSDLENL